MLTLTPIERRTLRARAHALNPVVMIGQHGLTTSVLREIDLALNSHELIKVRIFNENRDEREALQHAICNQLACAPVQHVGKLIILWRPAPSKAVAPPKPAKRPAKASKTAKKALPGAINRHGLAIKPLSARQARQLRDAGEMFLTDAHGRQPPRPGSRSPRVTSGKPPLQPPRSRTPRSASSTPTTPRHTSNRRRNRLG